MHKASETGIPARQLYVPACRESDGGYEMVQCHHTAGYCWCVDEGGAELPGTRTKKPDQPKCQSKFIFYCMDLSTFRNESNIILNSISEPAECPLIKCDKNCEHGYVLDNNGCNTCECRDPCADMKCPNEGEICKVVSKYLHWKPRIIKYNLNNNLTSISIQMYNV